LPLEERRVEIEDPVLERLVVEGKAERIGHEESYKLAWQRGGMRRLTIARVKYRTTGEDEFGDRDIAVALKPKELFWRCLAAPSLLAHIAVEKFCDGLPLFRIEERFTRDGVSVDRGTMSRWLEDLGATLGATVVHAMRKDVLRSAFCIATDATGIAIQPAPAENGARQACQRGHYFVMVADRDAVFFEYVPRETSVAVEKLFEGFSGYIQADAKSVYDALFAEPEEEPSDGEGHPVPQEVACWSHARRKYWEATAAKSVVAREGLARISRIFELDASWSARPHEDIKRLRDEHLRPHVDGFFAWAEAEFDKVRGQRGLLRSALGYSVRQRKPLQTFLEDGRLVLDNNRSERALRKIAVGRKAWLFAGSDEHAVSAGHLFTLIASARLHNLEPEGYLRDLIRVLPHWPAERYLELAPMRWADTRRSLNAAQLALELGPLAVSVLGAAPTSEQQPVSN
jgi:transposase